MILVDLGVIVIIVVRVFLEYGVKEENILFLNVFVILKGENFLFVL